MHSSIPSKLGTTLRRRFGALISVGLLGGALMAVVIANPSIESAGAVGNAVVPNSSIGGFAPVEFPGNDDGTYPGVVPLGFNINFFGTQYSGAYVNNNGNITFDAPLATFTPFGLQNASAVIVAPFFADVDTRSGNTAEFGTGTLGGHNVFVVNWPGVGCFNGNTTVLNNFQLILVDRPDRGTGALGDDFDVEFNYNSVQWDTGQASGGDANCASSAANAAAVGFSNGTTTPGDSFELTGSQSGGSFLDSNPTTGLINNDVGSNVLGRYLFTVHNGQPKVPPTVTTTRVARSINAGEDAAWTVSIVNHNDSALTGASVRLHANANGSTPLSFVGSRMPGCAADVGNSEVCTLLDIPANATRQFTAYVRTDGLANGTTITGDLNVSTTGLDDASGILGGVSIGSCGNGCVSTVGSPGVTVSSRSGLPTDAHPTSQALTLPDNDPSLPPVAITLNSITPGLKTPKLDKQLCPPTGILCTGQISVFSGNFTRYASKAHPIRIQIIAKWTTNVPPGKLAMQKATGPPIQLARCVFRNGKYNTPCAKPEVVRGSAAAHNLMTIDTVLFVGTDPHLARRASNTPDAPTAVRATAARRSAVLRWRAPVVTNGPITGYLVTPRIGRAAQRPVSFRGTGTTRTVPGLVTGTTYTFVVAAKNQHGISYQSIATHAVRVT